MERSKQKEKYYCRVCRKCFDPCPSSVIKACPTCGKEGIPVSLLDMDSPTLCFQSNGHRQRDRR